MTPEKLKEVFDAAQLAWYSVNIGLGAVLIWALVSGLNNAAIDTLGKPLSGTTRNFLAYVFALLAPVIIYAAGVDSGLVKFDMKGAALVIVASLKLANAIHDTISGGQKREARRAIQKVHTAVKSAAGQAGMAAVVPLAGAAGVATLTLPVTATARVDAVVGRLLVPPPEVTSSPSSPVAPSDLLRGADDV